LGRERNDTITADDRAPGLAELRQFSADVLSRIGRRLPFALPIQRMRARRRFVAALRAAARGTEPPSLAIVCYGNICRSPFAERVLAKLIEQKGGKVTLVSAGTFPVGGRVSPEVGVGAAKRFGIELETHRSQYLTDQMPQAATAILVFDPTNVDSLNARSPELCGRVFPLGMLTTDREVPDVIVDPYGGGAADYQLVYRQIETAMADVHALIRRASG